MLKLMVVMIATGGALWAGYHFFGSKMEETAYMVPKANFGLTYTMIAGLCIGLAFYKIVKSK